MADNIPMLTDKGRQAIQSGQTMVTARCRNILVQVDGKRSFDDIRNVLRGLEGLEEAIAKLVDEGFVIVNRDCKDIVKSIVRQMLGAQSPTLLKKIDEMHTKYGESCWEHLDELEKSARLFYGEVVAEKLKTEISKIIREKQK